MQNRPRARKKFVSGQSSHSSGRGYSGGGYSGGTRGGGGGIIKLIILVVLLLGGGGGAIGGGLGDYLSGMMNGQAITDSNIFSGSGTQSGWAMEKNTGRLDTRVADNAREKYTKSRSWSTCAERIWNHAQVWQRMTSMKCWTRTSLRKSI